MKYDAPVRYGQAPFFFYVKNSEVDGFSCCLIICKLDFCFCILTNAPVEVFNGVGSVNDFSDFEWVIEVIGKVVPVIVPGGDSELVSGTPFVCKRSERIESGFAVYCPRKQPLNRHRKPFCLSILHTCSCCGFGVHVADNKKEISIA